jgi:positive regulator of sigma E activity
MESPKNERPGGCPGECPGCGASERDEKVGHSHEMPDQVEGGLTGWKLAAAAVGMFLVPLVAAIAGAVLAGEGNNRKFLGAVIGLAVGVTVAVLVTKVIRKKDKES